MTPLLVINCAEAMGQGCRDAGAELVELQARGCDDPDCSAVHQVELRFRWADDTAPDGWRYQTARIPVQALLARLMLPNARHVASQCVQQGRGLA